MSYSSFHSLPVLFSIPTYRIKNFYELFNDWNIAWENRKEKTEKNNQLFLKTMYFIAGSTFFLLFVMVVKSLTVLLLCKMRTRNYLSTSQDCWGDQTKDAYASVLNMAR